MITEFTTPFVEAETKVKARLAAAHPASYAALVRLVVETINPEQEWELPDVDRIHVIDDGDYQGTLLFVIGAGGYQPCTYWSVSVGYGSCSGCDTFQHIREQDWDDGAPTPKQVDAYWTLALHIAQGLRVVGD